MTETIYNVPTPLLDQYTGQPVIIRSDCADELAGAVLTTDPEDIVFLQLLSLESDLSTLIAGGDGIPVELWITNPETEFPGLYNCAPLLDRHPVRVSIPAIAGVGRAIKLAVSLQFAVQIRVVQPELKIIEELMNSLDFYLRDATVSQPVDFFHNLFFSFLDNAPVPLWSLQDEDPEQFQHVSEHGEVTPVGKLSNARPGDETQLTVDTLTRGLLEQNSECGECCYLEYCGSYFKWPDQGYDCVGVKMLFSTLQRAAVEFGNDMQNYSAPQPEPHS